MPNTNELAQLVAAEMQVEDAAKGAPREEAHKFVNTLLGLNPKAKLPALVAKKHVRDWMNQNQVTMTILREAFAIERKRLHEAADSAALKIPPRRRKKAAGVASTPPVRKPVLAGTAPSGVAAVAADLFGGDDDGMVPN